MLCRNSEPIKMGKRPVLQISSLLIMKFSTKKKNIHMGKRPVLPKSNLLIMKFSTKQKSIHCWCFIVICVSARMLYPSLTTYENNNSVQITFVNFRNRSICKLGNEWEVVQARPANYIVSVHTASFICSVKINLQALGGVPISMVSNIHYRFIWMLSKIVKLKQ